MLEVLRSHWILDSFEGSANSISWQCGSRMWDKEVKVNLTVPGLNNEKNKVVI
jgi:hypothetical protein